MIYLWLKASKPTGKWGASVTTTRPRPHLARPPADLRIERTIARRMGQIEHAFKATTSSRICPACRGTRAVGKCNGIYLHKQ